MKLIIDINDNEYKGIKSFPKANTSYPWTLHLYDAVRNGTPLTECEDAVSRQAVLDGIADLKKSPWFNDDTNGAKIIRKEAVEIVEELCVKQLPSVKPQEPKTGHWINAKVGKLFPSNDFKCSECGNILDFSGVNCGRGDANFCPNCGADMRGNKNDK